MNEWWWHLVCFQFGAILNNAAINVLGYTFVAVIVVLRYAFLMSIYIGEELLVIRVFICLALVDSDKVFSKVVVTLWKIVFYFYLLNLFIFYLKDNCFTEFCCFLWTWINQKYTLNLPPIPSPSHPFRFDTEALFEFPETYSKFVLAIYFIHGSVSFHVTLFIHHPILLSSHVPNSVLYICFSIAALQIIFSVPSF